MEIRNVPPGIIARLDQLAQENGLTSEGMVTRLFKLGWEYFAMARAMGMELSEVEDGMHRLIHLIAGEHAVFIRQDEDENGE